MLKGMLEKGSRVCLRSFPAGLSTIEIVLVLVAFIRAMFDSSMHAIFSKVLTVVFVAMVDEIPYN